MKLNNERVGAKKILNRAASVVTLLATVGLAGCASGIKYSKLPKDADPTKELALLSQQINQAQGHQVDVYAPKSFAHAADAFNEANKARESDKNGEQILDGVAKSRAYLLQAEERANRTQSALGEVVTARTDAVVVEASEYRVSRKAFLEADKEIAEYSREADRVEGPKSISDADRTQVLAKFKEAELHATQARSLGHAQEVIEQATKEGAERLAPQSLAQAHGQMSKAIGVIRMDPKNVTSVEAASQEAELAADKVLSVTRLAKANQNKHPEAIASAALGEQEAAKQLEQQNAELKGRQGEILAGTILTETVKNIQTRLTADEAQVFEDGKMVHIRLKGLKFPSGKATIEPSEYPLVGKVAQILKDVKPEELRIDGRTDSRGSKKINQKLSEQRAESVKQFLIASNAVDPELVTTEGYGASRPVASEKTSEGRALNRSVDIVMVPGAVSTAGEAGVLGDEQAPGQVGDEPAMNPESDEVPAPENE